MHKRDIESYVHNQTHHKNALCSHGFVMTADNSENALLKLKPFKTILKTHKRQLKHRTGRKGFSYKERHLKGAELISKGFIIYRFFTFLYSYNAFQREKMHQNNMRRSPKSILHAFDFGKGGRTIGCVKTANTLVVIW